MCGLVLCNVGDVASEFAGVASSMELFGFNKYVSVPSAAVLVWLLVVYADYRKLEKIFVFLSFLYIAYIITAFLARPDWLQTSKYVVRLPRLSELKDASYLYLSVGIIGATIAPWQQFYLQASIVDKGTPRSDLRYSRIDAIVGSLFSVMIAAFIVIACAATLFVHGHHEIRDAADAAQSLRPLGGEYAYLLFAVGLLNASLFGVHPPALDSVHRLRSPGVRIWIDKKFREAPAFYWLYTALIVVGAAIILIPHAPLVKLAVLSQVLNGILLPFVLVFMLLLVNKRELMGRLTNSCLYDLVAWGLTGIIVFLPALLLISVVKA